MRKAALIVVDLQNDFCPGGALAVRGGDEVVPRLNRVIEAFRSAGLPILYTRDWHPVNHCSFKGQGGIWPPHCVADTKGAEFHPALSIPPHSIIVSKATESDSEAYSGFEGTSLEAELKRLGVTELFIGGLATDYCIKESALDGLASGFGVDVLTDCIKGVNLHEGDAASALRSISEKGARLMTSTNAVRLIGRRAAIASSS